ncbi:hypothetical protein Pcinc_032058 [Petrolisthes cinctipes]|uniref:Uncharacterized protein n=1 Tax=Petrolisthes cinctipes TaxID=88211 RepID=A0AAE1EV45_PETCI|nr:hypothetical protein Pcinc_032058 [Petrolisthes cinctipes]
MRPCVRDSLKNYRTSETLTLQPVTDDYPKDSQVLSPEDPVTPPSPDVEILIQPVTARRSTGPIMEVPSQTVPLPLVSIQQENPPSLLHREQNGPNATDFTDSWSSVQTLRNTTQETLQQGEGGSGSSISPPAN